MPKAIQVFVYTVSLSNYHHIFKIPTCYVSKSLVEFIQLFGISRRHRFANNVTKLAKRNKAGWLEELLKTSHNKHCCCRKLASHWLASSHWSWAIWKSCDWLFIVLVAELGTMNKITKTSIHISWNPVAGEALVIHQTGDLIKYL